MQPLGSKYFLETSIGRGSFGQVWRAQDRAGRTFAVKVLRPDLASEPEVVARFVRERNMIVGITSPYLVPVHDFVVEGDTLAIVMDLIEGHDLREELRRQGTFAPAVALRLAAAVCRGLAAVHERGIVHRDIKPSNILLDPTGSGLTAKITDFGVGWLHEDSHVTSTSSLVGTPEYMAPEYALGEPVTPAVDIYAVGIMMYEMLCGVTPFVGGNPMAVLNRQINNSPTRPESMAADVWEVVELLLVKQASARPTATVAAIALSQLAESVPDLPAAAKLAAPPASTPTDATARTERIVIEDTSAPGAGDERDTARTLLRNGPDTAATLLRRRGEVAPVFAAPVVAGAATAAPGPRSRRKLALIAAALTALLLVGGGTAIALSKKSDGTAAPDASSETSAQTSDQGGPASDSAGNGPIGGSNVPGSISVAGESASVAPSTFGSATAGTTGAPAGSGAGSSNGTSNGSSGGVVRTTSRTSAGTVTNTTVQTSVLPGTTTVVSGTQTVLPGTTVTSTIVNTSVIGPDAGSVPVVPGPTSEVVPPPAQPGTTAVEPPPPPAPDPPTISTGSLPSATTGAAYSETLSGSGVGSLTWSLAGGSLPDGMTLSPGGVISADPVDGTSDASFTVRATDDSTGLSTTADYTITVVVPPPPDPPAADPAFDVNGDGAVDCNDLAVVNAHLDTPGGFSDGDVTGDGLVDAADAAAVQSNIAGGC